MTVRKLAACDYGARHRLPRACEWAITSCMVQLTNICEFLETFAPRRLAEDWDNVGLLVGDANAEIERVMTCLTITPDSAAEAIDEGAQLIVVHHPLPFRPLKSINTGSTPGRMLWQLIQAGIAVYSPHTAFDSAAAGINQRLAAGLGLTDIEPLVPLLDDPDQLGAGRLGRLEDSVSLAEFADGVKTCLTVDGLHVVGNGDQKIASAAVACGSAGQFLSAAAKAGCDALVTGETSFHTCLEAEACGVSLLLPGHYASERFAVEELAKVLAGEFSGLEIWSSRREKDPIRWV